jgi:alpha/beta superfamily hydrolase
MGGSKGNAMEEKITFQSENLSIEGLIHKGSNQKGVVVTHPHPLYGGDMHNTVVETICRAYKAKDYTTLCFNFRGAGASEGRFDNGIGEQKDARAAMAYLKDEGITQIDLAGYSFGAWVNAQAGCGEFHNMVMVSPPVAFIDFDTIYALPCLKLVITGSLDDIAPPDQVQKMMPVWNTSAAFSLIEGADHFYGGFFNQLESIIGIHI